MELFGTLALLYLWQCTRHVPPNATLFVRWARSWREQPGGGRRLLHPWPSATALVGWQPEETAVGHEDGAPAPPSSRVAALEGRRRHALRHTRLLGWLTDAYAVWLFVLLPVLAVLEGEERALFYAAVPTLSLHVVALGLADRAHRKLWPSRRAQRFEQLLVCGLYPPALVRARPDLVLEACDGFHAMAVRGLLYPRTRCVESWCRERARLGSPRQRHLDRAAQRAALDALRDELSLSDQEITTPRVRLDPTAERYCPACLCDYRAGFDCCRDCGVPTLAYQTR